MAWSAPRTWVVGELVTAAIMNTFIRDNQLYLSTWAQNDVTGARAIDGTVYQNTTDWIMIVTIQISSVVTNAPQSTLVTIDCDAATPPVTQIGRIGLEADAVALGGDLTAKLAFTFVVLPLYYYQATEAGAAVSVLEDWFEWGTA